MQQQHDIDKYLEVIQDDAGEALKLYSNKKYVYFVFLLQP